MSKRETSEFLTERKLDRWTVDKCERCKKSRLNEKMELCKRECSRRERKIKEKTLRKISTKIEE